MSSDVLDFLPKDLDKLDIHDGTHLSMDSVMSITNEFSEGTTQDCRPTEPPAAKPSHNLDICLGLAAAYLVIVFISLTASQK